MKLNEFIAKLIILGFKKEVGVSIHAFIHKDYNAIMLISDTIIYLNSDWETEEDFDLLMEDIINGPKRINSEAVSDRFQTGIKRLHTPTK